jgi:hypothetical protein
MGQLDNKKVAFLATHGVEQVELTEPWKKVEDEGGTPELISLESGEIQGFNHLDKGDSFSVDRTVAEASESDYDGLVLPGGVANPDFHHLVAEHADRHPQRRWQLGGRGGRGGQRPGLESQAGRPTCLLRQAGRGDRRGSARAAGREHALRPRVVSAGRSI